jgi:hypothetical protein
MRGQSVLLAVLLTTPSVAGAQPALETRWARDVSPTHVLPEYPRPQLVRATWQNLNGTWDYAIRPLDAPQPRQYDGTILVPFPVESQLSGVRRAVGDSARLWYHRRVAVAAAGAGERVLLHFGAVDWDATVFLNGRRLGEHRGGYDPFSFDITDAMATDGTQDVVVSVFDPTDRGDQPRGKQVLRPRGIWYTAVTGIWQTVWIERVPAAYIASLHVVPDLDSSAVVIDVATAGTNPSDRVHVEVVDAQVAVARASGAPGAPIRLRIPDAKTWSPDSPFLYGLRVRLTSGDSVRSYFGLRKIAVAHDETGTPRLFLNGRPLFEYGLLDQGWWPDGLYTAPTEEARRFDITTMKRLGFNLIRKHVKVEPERWYFLCDSIGMLVWQDMPSGDNRTTEAQAEFAAELRHVVDARRDHPSIVMWVPFNEGWGQHETARYVDWLQQYDPDRLVDDASGWTDAGVGAVADAHQYPGPAIPATDTARAAVLGEFGGLGLPLAGHTWLAERNWGYRSFTALDSLGAAYRSQLEELRILVAAGLSAAVYTQTTDVENEVNGIMTYDREVVKLPPDAPRLHAMLQAPPRLQVLLPTSRRAGQPWRFTTIVPDSGWTDPGFDDSGWESGKGGFGTAGTPGTRVGTTWDTADLWTRGTFDLPAAMPAQPYLLVHHDEDAEIFINGMSVARLTGYLAGYAIVPLAAPAREALHAGRNLIAVHAHNTRGGQFIDVGLIDVIAR